jgi:hypothetical protein
MVNHHDLGTGREGVVVGYHQSQGPVMVLCPLGELGIHPGLSSHRPCDLSLPNYFSTPQKYSCGSVSLFYSKFPKITSIILHQDRF